MKVTKENISVVNSMDKYEESLSGDKNTDFEKMSNHQNLSI